MEVAGPLDFVLVHSSPHSHSHDTDECDAKFLITICLLFVVDVYCSNRRPSKMFHDSNGANSCLMLSC